MADETKRQPRDPVAALKEVFEALDFYRVAHECPFPAGGEVCHTEARLGAAILNAKPALDRLAAENAELRRVAAALVAVIDEACPRDCTCTFCRHALKAHVALMAVNRKVLDAK